VLVQAGIESVQELLEKPVADLVGLPGMNEKTAEKALAVARYALATHKPEVAAEVGFTPEMEKDEAAQAVASLEHPESATKADADSDIGPPPEAVEIEEQFDPDVVPPHLGTPPAEESDRAGDEKEDRA